MNDECKNCEKLGGYWCNEDCDFWQDEITTQNSRKTMSLNIQQTTFAEKALSAVLFFGFVVGLIALF